MEDIIKKLHVLDTLWPKVVDYSTLQSDKNIGVENYAIIETRITIKKEITEQIKNSSLSTSTKSALLHNIQQGLYVKALHILTNNT